MPEFAAACKVVMIAGSRAWLPNQTPQVYKLLNQTLADIWARGMNVIVGDNPQGVDFHVHSIATRERQTITVYGIAEVPRSSKAVQSIFCEYEQVIVPAYQTARDKYIMRDGVMLGASDHLLAFWNGTPESKGTMISFQSALAQNKRADLAVWVDNALTFTRRNCRSDK